MKFLSLELLAFGRFTDTRLDFGGDGGGFHVIHGANEAGKSTAMRALTDLLFGIPSRTTDHFLHEMKRLRVGGELLASSGKRLAILRRKGVAKTLLDTDGKELDDAVLAPFLGTATRDTFKTVFHLDHPGLIAGGTDLLAGRGNLAESLFQAAAGITGLRRVLGQITAEADELFRPNAARPRVNSALASYNNARRTARDATLKPAEWRAAQETRDGLSARVTGLRAKLDSERHLLRRLERQRAAYPHADKRAALLRAQTALGTVTLLPPDAASRREKAELDEKRAQLNRDESAKHLLLLQEKAAELKSAPEILAESARISDLAQRLREFRAAASALPDVSQPNRDHERGAADFAKIDAELSLRAAQLGRAGGGVAELERLPVPDPETVERFDAEFSKAAAEKERLTRELAEANSQWERNRAQIQAMKIGGATPSEADLTNARQQRNHLWQLLLEKWKGGPPPDLFEAAAFRADQSLESAYMDAVREADTIADRLRREAERVAAFANLVAEEERAVSQIASLEKRLAGSETKTAELQGNWQAAWRETGITPRAPREMQAWLRRHAELMRLAEQRRELMRTTAAETARFRTAVNAFAKETAEIVRAAASDLGEEPPDRAVEILQTHLARAQQDAARRQQVEEQIERERRAILKAEREIEAARLEIEGLKKQAGCATREALIEAEAQSQRARKIAEEIEIENRALAGHAAAQPVEQFAAEVAVLERDSLDQEIARLTHSILHLEPELAENQRELGEAEARLKSMDGGAGAAVAAEEAQAHLAEARDAAEQYIRLHLAGAILRRQIERYRRENQDPVLHRASALFSTLTLGSFSGVVTDFREKDAPVLLGVRPSAEEVEVVGMSEGTRDQLYLALRIASLERQLQFGEPLPFVVDDILMSFDDTRARAALSALAQLCAGTQVLFFTHHPHLVELARQAIPAALLREHSLG